MAHDLPLLRAPDGADLPAVIPAAQPPEQWRRLIAPIKRSKWLVIAITIAGAALGVFAARTLSTTYLARAVLWVEIPDTRSQNTISAGLLGVMGWVDLLRSHAVLDDVVRDQRLNVWTTSDVADEAVSTLTLDPTFQPGSYRLETKQDGSWILATAHGTVVDQGIAGEAVGKAIGFVWTPAASLPRDETLEFTVESYYEAGRQLGADLRIVSELGSNFIRLELRGDDPDHVAAIVNAVANRFVIVATDLKRKKQSELARILSDQLQHARRSLSESETALRTFRVHSAPLLTEGTAGLTRHPGANDPSVTGYLDARSELASVQRDRRTIERVLAASVKSGASLDMLGLVGAVQRSAQLSDALRELTARRADIRALRYRYTDENPEVRRVANQISELEGATIPELARLVTSELATREAELNRLVGTASGNLQRLPALLIEDARLSRDAQSAEEVLTRIEQRFGEARLAEVSSLPDVRVLDAAVPPEVPLGNVGKILILLATVGSFGVGVAGAMVRERVDHTVRDAGQVSNGFGLPILGALPHLHSEDGEGSAQAVDAFRGIRLHVMHTYGAAGPIVITVSSPGIGDGKSFVATNLALAFADAGFSTLLVDGDIRRGKLHRIFRGTRKPGLTDVLAGAAPFQAALQSSHRENLTYLACGSRTRSGPELLGSPAMTQLLVELRGRYRAILVDSPPLAAGVEPYILGTLTGNLLLVMRMGRTDRDLAEGKLDALDRLPVRVLGAVLNGVRSPDIYARYAYSLEGYELHDEETTWAEHKILRERA